MLQNIKESYERDAFFSKMNGNCMVETKTLSTKKEVRKFKVVELNGVLTQYYWKKTFWIFGYWVSYRNTFSSDDAYTRTFIKKIDDFINALENK